MLSLTDDMGKEHVRDPEPAEILGYVKLCALHSSRW